VVLVQACQDARGAYRNWFDSLSGTRQGGRVGHPRFRSRKDHRQPVRLTRNGFALYGERLYVAEAGDIRVRWSRALPSVPSSVTVIREADGRYYASFVVQRDATRCRPAIARPGSTLARNILALGRRERLNACGGDGRPGHALAVASEAGTHPSAT
jgi:hypothetical protein